LLGRVRGGASSWVKGRYVERMAVYIWGEAEEWMWLLRLRIEYGCGYARCMYVYVQPPIYTPDNRAAWRGAGVNLFLRLSSRATSTATFLEPTNMLATTRERCGTRAIGGAWFCFLAMEFAGEGLSLADLVR
jgi:hypothetical protein